MRPLIQLPILILLLILTSNCKKEIPKQENLLNYTVHIEDSIIYNIPNASRLCDQMQSEKRRVNIGDCNLYCEIEGEGIPLVLVHGGLGGTHHCFHPWLSGASKKFKIVYYDQRGCGLSDFNAGIGYSFEQSVDDLENLRKALKIDRWIVLGHSYGGGIAQYYTIKYPQSVMGLILVSSVPMMNDPELEQVDENCFLTQQEKQKAKEVLKVGMEGRLTMAQYFYNIDINGGWKRQNFLKPCQERQAQFALYDIVFDDSIHTDYHLYHFEHAFNNCPIPELICEGKYDSLWSAKKVPLMRKNHPNAEFRSFEKSSHNIYSDEPVLFIKEISDWVGSIKEVDREIIKDWKNYTTNLLGEQINEIKKGNLAKIQK
jgi:proline iminopeptidase